MIGSLRGVLSHRTATEAIVEVGGVGYRVTVPISTLASLPPLGSAVFFHVHTHVREDAIVLFGFATEAEMKLFTTLLSVSGIGPKLAIGVVSSIPHEEFARAIEAEDIDRITRVPGLGKKTAQRVVLELKGKLVSYETPGVSGPGAVFEDALSALVNLGYKKSDASAAIERARKLGLSGIEEVVREALKSLNKD